MVAQLDSTFLRVAPGRAVSRLIGYSFFEGRPLTTKGRWWNPVVFGNLRLAAGRTGKQVDRPVFIVGMGRSGTTLLGRILAAHPSVGFLNEPKAMWHVIRGDEDIIGSYAPPHTGRLYLGVEDANGEVIQRGRALYSWYLRASRSKRIVDKYPELIFRRAFVRAIFPDARFLIAVRSPWSTLDSVAAWSEFHAIDGADWWGARDQKWDILWRQGVVERTSNSDLATLDLASETDDHIRAAIEWIVIMREAISLAGDDPQARIILYDDLVQHPREMIQKALTFCELAASPRTESYAEAIVTAQRHSDSRTTLISRIPEALVSALDETWARVSAARVDADV
jgi:Sulfotransferase family